MQVLTITPSGCSISDLDQENVLRSLQALLGGFVEMVPFPFEGIYAFVNEEGKLRQGFSKNDLATTMVQEHLADGDYIAGQMVLVGLDDSGGTIGLTDEQISWLTLYAYQMLTVVRQASRPPA